ncbi:hypothetical protein [Nocardia brevicatena]|uniref:hypothetical protein n=1 Tax=Nocardia brevicatena TaxID=37327 RepID=UPI0002D4145E|nr:hypothetical protein [Nocardia brevicatena]
MDHETASGLRARTRTAAGFFDRLPRKALDRLGAVEDLDRSSAIAAADAVAVVVDAGAGQGGRGRTPAE